MVYCVKDVERSRKIPMDTPLLSIADVILYVNSRVACSVEWLCRKQYLLSEKSLLRSKYDDS